MRNLTGLVLAALCGFAAAEEEIRHRLTVKSFLDFGHVVNGSIPAPYFSSAGLSGPDVSMLPLNRANVLAIQEATLGRFDVAAGLAALIWWPYGGGITDASERAINVKPLVPVARARWQFGAPEGLAGSVMAGTFNYKYNPDAKNLGEYLYRAGTYPGFLWTNEGWLLMNRAGNYSHGLLLSLSHLGGRLKHNFSLFMETNYYPVGDFSPGYDFALATKWIEIGGGAVFHHYLPLRPSALEPREDDNTYVYAFKPDTTPGDTIRYLGPKDKIPSTLDPFDPAVRVEERHRWTHQGIKAMGRAALNLGHLLPEAMRGPEDLRLFAEVAVLGWEDQPLYFEDRLRRMPVMFGIHLPTFRLLDVLTLQGEFYRSPFNDINLFNTKSLPVWQAEFVTDTVNGAPVLRTDPSGKIIPVERKDDDFRWSAYAKKTVNKAMAVYVQAASDHFRLTDGRFKASSVPLTASPSEWYYLIRMEFSLR